MGHSAFYINIDFSRVIAGSRTGLSWARPRNYGGRPLNTSHYRKLKIFLKKYPCFSFFD